MGSQKHCGPLLSNHESKLAEEAKQRTLRILTDTLNKKSHLLVETPESIVPQPYRGRCPILSVHLVQDLLRELHKVTFRPREKDINETWIAYVYPSSSERVIYLCPKFWTQDQYRQTVTLLHEVSHFLGYDHTVGESWEGGSHNLALQQQLCPLTNYTIGSAFSVHMGHYGLYRDGQYHCCGERDRDSVCEKSMMSRVIRRATKPPLQIPQSQL
eukprot:XP_012826418.1 PREDICTED: uncharacterized protein LOC105948460 [Xenopus tropicalis]